MGSLIGEIVRNPFSSLMIVANLFLIESMLSVDNAAVMATILLRLQRKDRKRALKYGLVGAYIFRGLCLLLATYLIKIWWLKGLGGVYLIYLFARWLSKRGGADTANEEAKEGSKLSMRMEGSIGKFWATVISVELMDLAFSLDNVFAAVAYSGNILIVLTGVFIGILAMRFVAQGFVRLMEQYPFLEGCAYVVIGILGIKLTLSFYEHFFPAAPITQALENRAADWITSALTIGIFTAPILTAFLFNFPERKARGPHQPD